MQSQVTAAVHAGVATLPGPQGGGAGFVLVWMITQTPSGLLLKEN